LTAIRAKTVRLLGRRRSSYAITAAKRARYVGGRRKTRDLKGAFHIKKVLSQNVMAGSSGGGKKKSNKKDKKGGRSKVHVSVDFRTT